MLQKGLEELYILNCFMLKWLYFSMTVQQMLTFFPYFVSWAICTYQILHYSTQGLPDFPWGWLVLLSFVFLKFSEWPWFWRLHINFCEPGVIFQPADSVLYQIRDFPGSFAKVYCDFTLKVSNYMLELFSLFSISTSFSDYNKTFVLIICTLVISDHLKSSGWVMWHWVSPFSFSLSCLLY